MKKKWLTHNHYSAEVVSELKENLAVDETVAKLLALRGISSFDEAKTFFRPSLDTLYNPFLMKDT